MAVPQERGFIPFTTEVTPFPYTEYRKSTEQLDERDLREIALRTAGSAQMGDVFYPYDGMVVSLPSQGASRVVVRFIDTSQKSLPNQSVTLGVGSETLFRNNGDVQIISRSEEGSSDILTLSKEELSFFTRGDRANDTFGSEQESHDIVIFPRIVSTAELTARDKAHIAEMTGGLVDGSAIHYDGMELYFGKTEIGSLDTVTMAFVGNERDYGERRSLVGSVTVFDGKGGVHFVRSPSQYYEPKRKVVHTLTIREGERGFGRYELNQHLDTTIVQAAHLADTQMQQTREEASKFVRTRPSPPGNNR